jgi:hypothetical protein
VKESLPNGKSTEWPAVLLPLLSGMLHTHICSQRLEPSGPAGILQFNFLQHWSLLPFLRSSLLASHLAIPPPNIYFFLSLVVSLVLRAKNQVLWCPKSIYFAFSCWDIQSHSLSWAWRRRFQLIFAIEFFKDIKFRLQVPRKLKGSSNNTTEKS